MDIAVGVMIGLAFAAVVAALITTRVTAADRGDLSVGNPTSVSGFPRSTAAYEHVHVDALITFIVDAAAIFFFLVVKTVTRLMARRRTEGRWRRTFVPIPGAWSRFRRPPSAAHSPRRKWRPSERGGEPLRRARRGAVRPTRPRRCSTRRSSGPPSTSWPGSPATGPRSSSGSARAGSPCRSRRAASPCTGSTSPRRWSRGFARSRAGNDRRHDRRLRDDAGRGHVLRRVPRLQHDREPDDAGRAGRVLRERRPRTSGRAGAS